MVLPSAHGRSLWMYHASSIMFLNRPEVVIEHGCNTVVYIHVELPQVGALKLVMVSISTRTLGSLTRFCWSLRGKLEDEWRPTGSLRRMPCEIW